MTSWMCTVALIILESQALCLVTEMVSVVASTRLVCSDNHINLSINLHPHTRATGGFWAHGCLLNIVTLVLLLFLCCFVHTHLHRLWRGLLHFWVLYAPAAPCFLSRRPDADKNEDEIRKELAQLREVWHADQLELKKLHHVRQQ